MAGGPWAAVGAGCQAGVAGPGARGQKAGEGAPTPGLRIPGLLDQLQRGARFGAPVAHQVRQDQLAPLGCGQGCHLQCLLASHKTGQHA